ncbi:hypothetical protein GJAV_G00004460 [Gymnothorax javanicus]|nr:hypothetical protein GJAV_G00004460 [Gymnothorax javanicus]
MQWQPQITQKEEESSVTFNLETSYTYKGNRIMFSLWVMVLFLIGDFAHLLTEMPGKKGSCITILGTLKVNRIRNTLQEMFQQPSGSLRARMTLLREIHSASPAMSSRTIHHICLTPGFAGSRESAKVEIRVEYGPRNTQIKTSCCERGVPVGKSLTLTCEANADPQPHSYTWFRKVRQPDGARTQEWTEAHYWADQPFLTWERIKIRDTGMYMCQARNKINAENSSSLCVDVLYRPRGLTLSMSPSVRDSSLVAIHCTVESFPPSNLTITWSPYSNRHLSNIRKDPVPQVLPWMFHDPIGAQSESHHLLQCIRHRCRVVHLPSLEH